MGQLGGGYDTSQGTSESAVWDKQSPFLEQLFGMGSGLAQGFQPDQGIADQTRSAWQQQLQPMGNPYMSSFTNQFQDQLGQLNRQSGGQAGLTGGYGGGRQGVAQSLNTGNVADQMGRFMGGQYQGDMQRQADAIGMGGQVMGASGQGQQWANLGQFQGILGSPHNEQYQQDTSRGYSGNMGLGK
jgi:hypothetical protein